MIFLIGETQHTINFKRKTVDNRTWRQTLWNAEGFWGWVRWEYRKLGNKKHQDGLCLLPDPCNENIYHVSHTYTINILKIDMPLILYVFAYRVVLFKALNVIILIYYIAIHYDLSNW